MNRLLSKVGLGLRTYWQARRAIKRQFSREEILKIQQAKLRNLIDYCCHNIKYYREAFARAGIRPGEIRSVQELRRVPFLTKEELRSRLWDFLPHELPACRVSRTSGSTGVPVCLLSDRNSRMFNSAAVLRYRLALGIRPIGGPILTPLKAESEPNKKPHWTFLQGIHRTYYVNPYVESEQNIKYAQELLRKLRRPAVIGITPAVRHFAYRVRDGLFPSFEPSIVLTSGEALGPEVRHLLESTFRTKVADVYGCNEAGDVAWQCGHGASYHINADNVIVEIVDNDKPVEDGRIGEVVITNLNRYAMPIIRYKNGDLARLASEPCPCGRRLAMIAEIVGRTGEDIFIPNGRTLSWNQLKGPMNHPLIRQFQLVQSQSGSLSVKYVGEKDVDTEALEGLLADRYRSLLGPSIAIKFERVGRIAPAASGKSKYIVSHFKSGR